MNRHAFAALAALLVAHSAAAQTSANTGSLAQGDRTLSSGEFVDSYTYNVPRGAAYLVVSMVSDDFDTYLLAASPSGQQQDNDDAGEDNTNSTLLIERPEPGAWSVMATSYATGTTGGYSLVMDAGELADVLERIANLTDSDYAGGSARLGAQTSGRTASAGDGKTLPGQTASAPSAGMTSLRVVNATDQELFYFYASRCTDSGWGDDRLGSDTIPAGDSWTIELESGCWDLKAKFQDEQETEQRNWELEPGPGTWTINIDGD